MEALQINKTSVRVKDVNGVILLVAKYEDEGGPYFLDENLKKKYAIVNKSKNRTSTLKSFDFYVEYWHGGTARRKTSTVKAKDFDLALVKVRRNFKSIIDIEEC